LQFNARLPATQGNKQRGGGLCGGKASYYRHWHLDAPSQERMQALIFGYLFIKKKVRALPAVRKRLAPIKTLRTGKI
jgi:hypothetical protein